jgi:hypothetical protein
MEPVNKNQRKTAIGRFVGMYMLSLTFPIAGVYLLLRVPDSVSAAEAKRYRQIVEEQTPMLVDTDTLSLISRRLIQLDGVYSSASDEMGKATARTQLVDIESRINSIMSHFNTLSATAIHEQNKRLSTGIAKLTEALVTYRETIGELRRTLDSKGIDVQVVNDLRNQINMKDLEIKSMERQLLPQVAAEEAVAAALILRLRNCRLRLQRCNAIWIIVSLPNRAVEAAGEMPQRFRNSWMNVLPRKMERQ